MKKILLALLLSSNLCPMMVHQGNKDSPQAESGKNCVHVTINNDRTSVNADKEKSSCCLPNCPSNCLTAVARATRSLLRLIP
jgi:hypothetical protein